jgi:hypothetical protein
MIQKRFLWELLRWNKIYLGKKDGGLGVKYLELFKFLYFLSG